MGGAGSKNDIFGDPVISLVENDIMMFTFMMHPV